MPKIEPTVGRVVHLRHPAFPGALLAGQIAAANEDGTINVGFLSPSGGHHSALNVQLVQDGDVVADVSLYAEWMPYQKGQAAKTEELEKQIEAKRPAPAELPSFDRPGPVGQR